MDRVLLERGDLLASLGSDFVDAARGVGRVVFVGGEAGVGKTSLTTEFARTVSGVRVLRGAADSPTTAAPLGLFLDAMAGEVPGMDDLLGNRARLFPAVRSALAETATLLVLEDLHWADEATLDLLGYLSRRLDGVPVLILGTFRDDEVTSSHPLTIVLGDLATRAGVVRMHVPPLTARGVRRLADEAGSSVDADELFRRTGGNPFFVTEALAAGGGSNLPPSVRDATLARASRLSPAARRVLDAAAVIGPSIELDLLADVSGQPPEAIDECCERGLLIGAGARLEFRHELARLAVEEAVPTATGAGLHAAVLAWLTDIHSADARRLARHAEAAGDGAAVLIHARQAGDRAAQLGAHREAADQYRAALRHGHRLDGSARAELLELLSYECYLTDQLQAATDAQAEALAEHRAADDARSVGVALRWLSRLTWFLGRNADSARYAEESLATLSALPAGPELAMAYSNLSQLRMLSGDTAGAVLWGEKAIELARTLGDRQVECHALNNVGTALSTAGQLAEGSAQLARSLDLALATNAPEHAARAYTNLGSVAVVQRRFVDADRQLRAGIAYCLERDLDSWRLYMSAYLARSLAEQGRWQAARREARDVLRHPRLSPVTRLVALVVAAEIAVRRGEPGADSALAEALALAEPTGEDQRLVPVVHARAEAAWTTGRSISDELARARWTSNGEPWADGELAWWSQRAGVSVADQPSIAEPFSLMLSGRATEAAAAWDEVGSPFWRALALTGSDRAGDVRAGVEILRSLGAKATVHAVLRDLQAQGKPVPRGPQRAGRGNPAGLTHRELEVLALLVAGLSNAEIAAHLYLSEKTGVTTCQRFCASSASPPAHEPRLPPYDAASSQPREFSRCSPGHLRLHWRHGQPRPTREEKLMPLFMDVHSLGSPVTIDEVAKAHAADVQTQPEFDVRYLRYWVDEQQGKIFCLVDAPDADAANTVHRKAHGLVADEIFPVQEGI